MWSGRTVRVAATASTLHIVCSKPCWLTFGVAAVGAEKMAEAIATGAAEAACIGALTAICPPAGMAAGLAASLKHMYDMAKHADKMANGKTKAERKRAAKLAIIAVAADAGD